jgi:hypothetical protein
MVTAARRLIAIVGCTLLGLAGTSAEAETDGQQRVVERARLALDSFLEPVLFKNWHHSISVTLPPLAVNVYRLENTKQDTGKSD